MSPIHYTIRLDDMHGHRFDVSLTIQKAVLKKLTGNGQAGLILQLPAWIPGSYMIRDFSKHLENLKISTEQSKSSLKAIDSHTWQINDLSMAADLELTYQVYAFDTSVRTAYLDQTRAFFNPTSLCLRVLNSKQESNSIAQGLTIRKPHLANYLHDSQYELWEVVTGLSPKKIDSHGFGDYEAKDYDELIDHPVAIGEFQRIKWTSHGTPHQMVIQGAVKRVDEKALARDLQAICNAQIEFFEPTTKRAPFKKYFFLVNAVGDGYGGLEHRNSTALLCKREDLPYLGQDLKKHSAYEDFLGLCSHEYFHAWMVKRVRPKAFIPYDLQKPNHTQLLWLFEGFTSYYDDLFLLRSARIDLKQYLKRIEKTWNMVLRGPGRHKQSVAQSSWDAWTKYYQMDENTPNAVVSYYAKGSLIALGLDLLIRDKTRGAHSLDTLMRHFWQMYQLTEEGLAEDDMAAAIRFLWGPKIYEDWRVFEAKYIHGCEDLPLDRWLPRANQQIQVQAQYLANAHTQDAERIKQAWGIRISAVQGWIKLTHVLDGGLAQQAGLAAGDYIASIDRERVTPNRLNQILVAASQALNTGEDVQIQAYRHETLLELVLEADGLSIQESLPAQYCITVQ